MTIFTRFVTATTTDATTEVLWTSPTGLHAGFVIYIGASSTTADELWSIHAARSDADSATISTSIHSTPGGTSWSVEVFESGSALNVDITGESATTVNWVGHITFYEFDANF